MLYFSVGASLTSSGNTIQNCVYGQYGVYYLNYIDSITDSNSNYKYNSGANGGVYYIQGNVISATTVTINTCTYSNNFGAIGGVFAVYDYVKMTLTQLTFTS